MTKSLLLGTQSWDLTVDAGRNIAVASNPYACAQDAACAIRLFKGELYFQRNVGVPYWALILGKRPTLSLMKQKLTDAALSVPEIAKATVYIAGIDQSRNITGQVQITDIYGNTAVAAI